MMRPVPFSQLTPGFAVYLLLLFGLTGTCAGSFVNCAVLRGGGMPRGRSRCPSCKGILGVQDLIPLFSWLALRGRCRLCGARVSLRYPLTEGIGGLLWVSCLMRYGFSWRSLECALLLTLLLALSLHDMDTMILPDSLMFCGVMLWLMFLPMWQQARFRLRDGILGAAALGGSILLLTLLMDRLLKQESMGGGDIKLVALLGLNTGPAAGLLLMLMASILGLVLAWRWKALGRAFPFGPALALAAWPTLLYGDEMVRWYVSLCGGA